MRAEMASKGKPKGVLHKGIDGADLSAAYNRTLVCSAAQVCCSAQNNTSGFQENPMFISSAYAQTAAAGTTEGTLMSMLPLVLMFVVLYFVMIRPQMKKQKEHKAMIEALAKGDEVVTAGGMLGKVSKLGEAYIGVELATGVEVQMQRSAVVQVLPKGTIK
jgi:preprotein translocase subunit YajC